MGLAATVKTGSNTKSRPENFFQVGISGGGGDGISIFKPQLSTRFLLHETAFFQARSELF